MWVEEEGGDGEGNGEVMEKAMRKTREYDGVCNGE
jgi:hypothetical protein